MSKGIPTAHRSLPEVNDSIQKIKSWLRELDAATGGTTDLSNYITSAELDETNSNVYSNSARIQTLEEQDAIGEKTKYQIVTVAKAGGDFDTIQGAIDSITDATTTKRYAIKVYPGNYAESVTMKNYVDIIGTGRTNSRITGTSGTVLTFPSIKATILDMGIYVDYGTLGATSTAITSAGADSVMIRCDIGVTKSGGDYVMNAITATAGSFRMSDCYFTYSITGATTATSLNQSAIVQSGILTTLIVNNNEIIVTSNDTNDNLIGFETTANVAGIYLLANNIVNVNAGVAGASATALWLYGTSSGATIAQNRLTVNCNASSYGLWIDSTSGGAVVDTRHNEIIVTSVGAAESANIGVGDTWNSVFDKITASSGYNNSGTVTFLSSSINGSITATGTIATATLNVGASTAVSSILDEDDMASDSATALSTQQSIKKYVLDTLAGGVSAFTSDVDITLSGNQSVASGSTVKIVFDTVVTDTNSEWDAVNNRINILTTGTYVPMGCVRWANNSTGLRSVLIKVNNTTFYSSPKQLAVAEEHPIETSRKIALTAGDYVEIFGYQTSGGALNALSHAQTRFQMFRVA